MTDAPEAPEPITPAVAEAAREAHGTNPWRLRDFRLLWAGRIAPGDLVDLPQQGRGLDLNAEHGYDPPQPEQAEVPDGPGTGRFPVSRRRRRRRRPGVYALDAHVRRSTFGYGVPSRWK